MDSFFCDYECRTVGESLTKHNIPDNWCAEFDAYDGIHPIFCITVDQIRKIPAMMELKLRIVEDPNEELAGCMLLPDRDTIGFKIDYMRDLIKALATDETDE